MTRLTTELDTSGATQYRAAERRLWESVGATPTEREVGLPNGCTIRLQEVGEGRPTLFLHGGPNAGSTWAPLAARLQGIRCILIDRPGTGLSDPWPQRLDVTTLPAYGDGLVAQVLDALHLDVVDVVASSFGGYVALRSAAAHPSRVRRMVQMACPAFAEDMALPPFMRLLGLPGMARLVAMLPPNERANESILRQIGHGASLDAGRFLPEFPDFYEALQRHTDTMRNDGLMISSVARLGRHRSIALGADVLGAVTAPTAFLWGADDTFGGEQVARRMVEQMPDARLEMVPASGHLPWLDDPAHAAAFVQGHLDG